MRPNRMKASSLYSPLRLAGRDVYVREGCYNCHSQMIRPFRSETERYGPFTTAGETVYDRPFQFGSKRTGPDLARVGGRYSDDWQRLHLMDPRALVPESNMPGYPWLADNAVDRSWLQRSSRLCDCSATRTPMSRSPAPRRSRRQDRTRCPRCLPARTRHQPSEPQVSAMDINDVRGILTAVIFFAFIGIWVWAWSSRRKTDFEASAALPLEEDTTLH